MKKFFYTCKITLVAVGIALCNVSVAQTPQRGKFSRQNFRAQMERSITEKAGLTDKEAKAFFPLYNEMKDKQHRLIQEKRKLELQKMNTNASDKEYANIIFKIKSLNTEVAETEESYYRKMCKVIPARKVFAVMIAENEFHKEMLSRFNRDRNRSQSSTRPSRRF